MTDETRESIIARIDLDDVREVMTELNEAAARVGDMSEPGFRLDCLRLALSDEHMRDGGMAINLAKSYADFVLNGTVPSKPN